MTKYRSTETHVIEEERPLQLLKLAIALLLLFAILGLLLAALWFVVRPPLLLYPHPDDQLPDGRLTVSGSSARGAQIEVLVDGRSRGTTPVNQDGGWSLTTDVQELGEHWVHSQVLNRFGVVMAASAPIRFFRVPPALPVTPLTTTTSLPAGAIIISNTVAPSIVVQVGPTHAPTPWSPCGNPCSPTPLPTATPAAPPTVNPPCTPTPTVWRPDPLPTSCTDSGSGRTYRVAAGDSLSKIATRFGVTVRSLLAANPRITNPNLLRIGQVLTIPER
jgi:hypothetical protein